MVLEYWAVRKKQQDACMQFVQYEASAKQVCNLHHLPYLTHYSSSICTTAYSLPITYPRHYHRTLPVSIIIMDQFQKLGVICSSSTVTKEHTTPSFFSYSHFTKHSFTRKFSILYLSFTGAVYRNCYLLFHCIINTHSSSYIQQQLVSTYATLTHA